MKKFLVGLVVLGLASVANALSIPTDQNGQGLHDARFSGARSCVVDASTGTAAALCATGAGVVLGVIVSSVAATDFLMLRDSATANTTSAKLMALTAGATGNVFTSGIFPKFSNGLSANVSVAPVAGTGNWTILYRLQSDLK